MPKKRNVVPYGTSKILKKVGENIKLARLRRDMPARIIAERAFITRQTLIKIEKGDPSVSMGAYASTLHALGMDKDLLLLAKDDVLGNRIINRGLLVRKRAKEEE